MSLFGNILWLIFGGLIAGLIYIIAGLILCITLIGIPFGLQSIKLGLATLAPFGKECVPHKNAANLLRIIFSLLWLLTFGWVIALTHLIFAIVLAITLIGIPFAIQHIKLIPISLMPFSYNLVYKDMPENNDHA